MDAIDRLIEAEGGFSNDPADHGGPTNMGITQATLSAWRGHPVSVQDVRDLQPAEARSIYEKRYLKDPHIDMIPHEQLRELILDIGVLSGPTTGIKLLQLCLHDEHGQALIADGVVGHNTLRALWGLEEPEQIVTSVVKERVRRLVDLAQKDLETLDPVLYAASQLRFLEGWVTRTMEFLPS